MLNSSTKDYIFTNIKNAVSELYNLSDLNFVVEYPQNPQYGDYATNVCLILKSKVHKTSEYLSKELIKHLKNKLDDNIINKISYVEPGFINFSFSQKFLLSKLNQRDVVYNYQISKKNILIEYSQPNPNKPQHIGHARNNFLGSTIANLYEYLGHNVIKANYYNDWSTAVCKSMLMYEMYYKNKDLSNINNQKSDHFVGDLYILYSKIEQENSLISEKVQEMFQNLEKGDKYTTQLWEKITNMVYKGWETTYKDQNVFFDVIFRQSDYKISGKDIIDLAIKKGIAVKDKTGAVVANLKKYNLPDKVLLRSDGTSIYITQDLQLAVDTFNKYKLDKRLYVVDNRQADYFKQLFKILEMLEYKFYDKVFHISYGFVSLPQGKMSSRTGVVVNADDAFEQIIKHEEKEIEKSVKELSNKQDTIKKIALSAFRYAILKVDPKKDVVFVYDQVTKFEGNTGPYLMYTYARMNSLITKSNRLQEVLNIDFSKLNSLQHFDISLQKEYDILRHITKFNEIVLTSAIDYSPNILANFLFELSQKYNSFYSSTKILTNNHNTEADFRLILTLKTCEILKKGLELLGIEVVNKM